MAEVFLARATGEAGFEKTVALKVLHASLARNQRAVAHFLDEARLASRLSHPNIVQITDLGRAGEEYFIAMEYVEGSDLDQLLYGARRRGVQVPIPIALTILRRVCDGLHAAHMALGPDGLPLHLVHRDVKSANVLLSTNGVVKIVDFGIAKASQQLHVTSLGETKGTAAVMAPEQRIGKPVDRRADVYGAGALGYELLVGAEVNLDLAALIHLSVDGWPHLRLPSEVRPELPRELDAVLFRALAFEPDQRHDSCAALEEDLDRIAAHYGLNATDKQIAQWMAGERAEAAAARIDTDPAARGSDVVASGS
jgi:serine/threonine-protein kinase